MSKNSNFFAIALVVLTIFLFLLGTRLTDFSSLKHDITNITHAAGSKEAFDYLSSNTNSYCGLAPQTVDEYSNDESIKGACCGAMDFHRYQEQVAGLKKFSNISQIPEDPYNIPAPLAKELFEYQKTITLTSNQQEIYDAAMEISHEGGPCCCRCWRWTAFEGQAKYLITRHNFTAEQIAKVWDMEDGCGGPGHVEGESHGH